MRMFAFMLLVFLIAGGCQRSPEHENSAASRQGEINPAEGGAVSSAPIVAEPQPPPVVAKPAHKPVKSEIDWSPLQLEHGTVALSCVLDYQRNDEVALTDFSREGVHQALLPCAEQGLVRMRYQGKIDDGFASVTERVTVIANELGINKRVLDVDSPGGLIEEAIRAGDFIAESHWTIWVREGSMCHSACVFILGAGDTRIIAGKVGIHRIIRMSSTATTRAELNAELNAVYLRVRDYFERNGIAVAVADLMMAVPNRSLRLLTTDELRRYGLDGVNPVQDDLDRLRLMRKCGDDFVVRRDAFLRAFERDCKATDDELDAINNCGLGLRKKFGFPDSVCPTESPLSEFDVAREVNLPAEAARTGETAEPGQPAAEKSHVAE